MHVAQAMNGASMDSLSELLYNYGGPPVGSLVTHKYAVPPLLPKPPFAVFMDVTHDNPTPFEKVTLYSNSSI